MIEKKIVVYYEVPGGRNVIAYFQMVLMEDGRELSRSQPHNVNFSIDCNAAEWLEENNQYLQHNKDFLWPEIPNYLIANTLAIVASQHTPEIKAAYATFKAALEGK